MSVANPDAPAPSAVVARVSDARSRQPLRTRHRLNPVRLRAEILKRGLDGRGFARHAGISEATLSHVINGHGANPRTITAIAAALIRLPVVPGLDELIEVLPGPPETTVGG